MELYHYAVSQPEIPNVEMSFSNSNVTAYVDGGQQRTEDITFKASSQQTITMDLPDGVKLHNISTGKTSAARGKGNDFRRYKILSDGTADTDERCVRIVVRKNAGKHYQGLLRL